MLFWYLIARAEGNQESFSQGVGVAAEIRTRSLQRLYVSSKLVWF
jgi:hypothetical protein